jgi:hypothetical protein
MNTNMLKNRLQVVLAACVLAGGLAGTARAFLPPAPRVGNEPAAAGAEADDPSPKVERRVVVKTADAESDEPANQEERRVIVRSYGGGSSGSGGAAGSVAVFGGEPGVKEKKVIVLSGDGHGEKGKEVAWLGVSTEEAGEALTAQLGLQPGEGLLVTYVATNSPAAKAGLEKNDLLLEMEGQKLLLPTQLRKLVHLHKEGDPVELKYIRAGKRQSTTAILGKTRESLSWFGDSDALRQLQFNLKDLGANSMENLHAQMQDLHESLARAGVDREKMQVEIRRGVDEARKAMAEAMAQMRTARHGAHAGTKTLDELASTGVEVDKDATVTIKRRGDSVRTMVKTDDNGTYVLVADPKKKLTAHDKEGKLLFDGEIETSEQQSKVPRDVWKQVQPMIEQLNGGKDEELTPEEPAPKKTSAAPAGDPLFRHTHLLANLRTFLAMTKYLLSPESGADPLPATRGTNALAAAGAQPRA